MTWILMAVVVAGACWIAWVMMQRISDTQQKLGALHEDLRRNNIELQRQMQKLQQEKTESTPRATPDDKEIES
jgi:hypothetical protein